MNKYNDLTLTYPTEQFTLPRKYELFWISLFNPVPSLNAHRTTYPAVKCHLDRCESPLTRMWPRTSAVRFRTLTHLATSGLALFATLRVFFFYIQLIIHRNPFRFSLTDNYVSNSHLCNRLRYFSAIWNAASGVCCLSKKYKKIKSRIIWAIYWFAISS